MQTVGPLSLSVNVPGTDVDPQNSSGNVSSYVQVQNGSFFTLSVISDGDIYTIQPWIAQTIPVSGQPLIITPLFDSSSPNVSQLPAGYAPNVYLIWLLYGEIPPQADGPLPQPQFNPANNTGVSYVMPIGGSLVSTVIIGPSGSGGGAGPVLTVQEGIALRLFMVDVDNYLGGSVSWGWTFPSGFFNFFDGTPSISGDTSKIFGGLLLPPSSSGENQLYVTFSETEGDMRFSAFYDIVSPWPLISGTPYNPPPSPYETG